MPVGQGEPTVSRGNFAVRVDTGDNSVLIDIYKQEEPNLKIGELRVRYDRADGQPGSVRLDLATGLTPTVLQRFPWARWLTIADAANHGGLENGALSLESDRLSRVLRAEALGRRMPKAPAVKRPGRGGHPEDFYISIARRYRELRLGGSSSPTQTIAKEQSVSRSTAAGWVHKARQRGHLKKIRPGKAGG